MILNNKNTQVGRWPIPIDSQLKPSFRMRLYSPNEAAIESQRRGLIKKISHQETAKELVKHTVFPCYFNKKYRTFHYFFMKRSYIKLGIDFNKKEKELANLRKNLFELEKIINSNTPEIKKYMEGTEHKKNIEELISYNKGYFFIEQIGDSSGQFKVEELIGKIVSQIDCSDDGREYIKTSLNNFIDEIEKEVKKLDDLKEFREAIQEKLPRTKNEKNMLNLFLESFIDFPIPATWYEAGIVYQIFQNLKGEDLKHMKGDIIRCFYMPKHDEDIDKREISIVHSKREEKEKFHIKEPPGLPRKIEYEKTDGSKNIKDFTFDIKKKLYVPLFHLFNERDDMFTERTSGGSQDSKTEEKKECLLNNCFVVPVYEIYVDGIGSGGIQGLYVMYQEEDIDIENKVALEIAKYLLKVVEPIASEMSEIIFLSDVLEAENRTKDISPRKNYLEYFLEMIVYTQNWQNIWIISKSIKGEDGKLHSSKLDDDLKIIYHWGRTDKEYFLESKWGEIKIDSESKKCLRKAIEAGKCFEFSISECEGFLEEGDGSFLEDYKLVFQYSDNTILPEDFSNHEKEYINRYKERIKERILRILEIAIAKSSLNKYKNLLDKTRVYIEQMSHNLHHALLGMARHLRTEDLAITGPVSDITANHITGRQEAFIESIRGCHNFFWYLVPRFKAFSSLGLEVDDSLIELDATIEEAISIFNNQNLFCQYITDQADSVNIKSVTLELITNYYTPTGVKFRSQPFFMLLENYIRNVAKYGNKGIAKGIQINEQDMKCYLDITRNRQLCKFQLWEDTEKEIPLGTFYKNWEELQKFHKVIRDDDNPINKRDIKKIPNRGLRSIEYLTRALAYPRASIGLPLLEVIPVVVDGKERHKIEEKSGNYFICNNGRQQQLSADDKGKYSMEYNFEVLIERLRCQNQ